MGLLGDDAGQPLVSTTAAAFRVPADLRDRYATGGFDLHATRRVSAEDRTGRERLCRYILHPALSHDRLAFTTDGRVRVRFTRPWRNGVDSMTLDPLSFIARLVPLVPRPGTHRLRYHGVLASRSALRSEVVRDRTSPPAQLLLFPPATPAAGKSSRAPETSPPALPHICWAQLLKRMAGFEMECCPHCGAQLCIVGAVLEAHEIRRMLDDRGLCEPIPTITRSPARGPPASPPSPQLLLFPMAA